MRDYDYGLINQFLARLAELVIETRRIADALQEGSPLLRSIRDVADQVADVQ